MGHHFSDSITSFENLSVRKFDCITRPEFYEFKLKVINITRKVVVKIKNLKDEIITTRKDIEPTFDKNLRLQQPLTTVC